MADDMRPLSRRERREMEVRAELAAVTPEVAAQAPGRRQARTSADAGMTEDELEAAALSRRDRRRLERLEQPMETWTAVEEMHHTGQVPTMTPEVIAQQEELARRRAEAAHQDAVRATGEMRQVGAQQVSAAAIDRVVGGGSEPAGKPQAAAPVGRPAPPVAGVSRYEMPDELPAAAQEPEPPAVSRYEMPDEPAAAPQEPEPPAVSRYEMPDEPPVARPVRPSSSPGDDARRRLAEAAATAAAGLPAEKEPPRAVVRREHGVIDAPRPATAEVPSLADFTPPTGVRATSGPQGQGGTGLPAYLPPPPAPSTFPPGVAAQGPPMQAAPMQAAPTQAAPMQAAPMQAAPMQAAPILGVPAQGFPVPGFPVPGVPVPGVPVPGVPVPGVPVPGLPVQGAWPTGVPRPPSGATPIINPAGMPPGPVPGSPATPMAAAMAQPAPFPTTGPPSQQIPLPPTGPPSRGVAQAGAPAPAVGQVIQGTPQAVSPVQAPAPSPYPPGTALSPITTGMLRPVPGGTGTMRAIPGGGPMTGTIPRPIVEVQPAGGARDFGWPHIAVLAAVAFTLGIVVWKISGLGG